MKEAMSHITQKNEALADELQETQKILKLHKELLDAAMKNQTSAVDSCESKGDQLLS